MHADVDTHASPHSDGGGSGKYSSVIADAPATIPPESLSKQTVATFLSVASDVFSILAWVAMLIYAALLWHYNGRSVQSIPFSADRLSSAATTLSTIFSILFAATVARVLRSLALWLLERGSKIGLLDQLVGSVSVSSAVVTQWSFGIRRSPLLHVAGLGLILLWLLSPLGSQAILRILSFPLTYDHSRTNIPYLNISSWYNLPPSGSDSQLLLVPPNTLVNAVLMGPMSSKEQVQDAWSNVKIPRLSRMPVSKQNTRGWTPVEIQSSDDFSSLVGLPFQSQQVSDSQKFAFSVESWYWDMNCMPWTDMGTDNASYAFYQEVIATYQTNSTAATRGETFDWPATIIYFNHTGDTPHESRAQSSCNDRADHNLVITDCPQLDAKNLTIRLNSYSGSFWSTCAIATTYVETAISCQGVSCAPYQMRESQQPHPSKNWTALDVWTGGSIPAYTMSGLFLGNFANSIAGRKGGSGGANALSGYIVDPGRPFTETEFMSVYKAKEVNTLLNITDDVITSRFVQVMNSYWMTSVGYHLMVGSNDVWEFIQNANESVQLGYSGMPQTDWFTNTTVDADADLETPIRRLQCSVPWLMAFTVVSLIAFTFTCLGFILALNTWAPRLSMNVSTMLRDSRYSDVGTKGSYLDDGDRSRMMQDTVVRIGDVAPDRSYGHIAVSTITGTEAVMVDRLQRGRLYD